MNEIDKREFTNVEVFDIATMSAGKSMLINTLLSKKLLLLSNEVCTDKIHCFHYKPFEDSKIINIVNN